MKAYNKSFGNRAELTYFGMGVKRQYCIVEESNKRFNSGILVFVIIHFRLFLLLISYLKGD
jgi:hypothetical protein